MSVSVGVHVCGCRVLKLECVEVQSKVAPRIRPHI